MNRIGHHFITIATALSLGVTTSWATAARAGDGLDLLSSRGPALAFAVSDVCVPYLRRGGTVAALAGRSGVAAELDGRPAVRLHGFGRVFVAVDPASRSCVIVTHTGDGRTARAEALSALESGYLLETLTGANEAVLHGRKWAGLNEAYCFRLDEKVVEVDISTARDQDRDDPARADSLRLRLYWSDAEAMKKGVCRA